MKRTSRELQGWLTAAATALGFSLITGMTACARSTVTGTPPEVLADSATYVVRLGRDTSYVQWVVRDGHHVRMDVVERRPRVRHLRTTLTQNMDGSVAMLERLAFLPGSTTPVERAVVRTTADSTIIEIGRPEAMRRSASPGRGHIVNAGFLMVSYPVLAPYAPLRVGDSVVTRQLASLGDRVLTIKRIAPDTFTLSSNLMGRVRVHVDARGRSHGFDAIGSSINMQGERVPWLSVDSVLSAFAAQEQAAGVAGSSSPRDTVRAIVGGAALVVDYSRPSKRGRQVFGGIVPWHRVWRTGANVATHFSTDRALQFGDVRLAPGRYTLWTLPAPEGWTLIVNRQTGQWGTDYDPAFDVLRLPMQLSSLPEPVEQFAIAVEPQANGGVLRLRWDTTEARAAFTVDNRSPLTIRAQAIRAATAAGDHAIAIAIADSLVAELPDYPNVVFARAIALGAAGRREEASNAVRALLRWDPRFARRALQDTALAFLRPELRDVDSLAAAANHPIGRGLVWRVIPERDLVPEGTAWDGKTRSLLIGSLNKHKIVAILPDGTLRDRVPAGSNGLRSVVGIHVDSARGLLWAASNSRHDNATDTTTSALFAFDAASGAFRRKVPAPPGMPHFLNDVTTDREGSVYVTDTQAGRVWVLRVGADTLERFADVGPLTAPNGITISDDGRFLFVADIDHVQVVSLGDRTTWRLATPDSINMSGIDGLAFHRGALVAHHPLAFWRIARYQMDAGLRQVTSMELIERNTPDSRTSTTGEVVGDEYHYIGNSQIDRMNARTIDPPTMEPVRIYRFRFPP